MFPSLDPAPGLYPLPGNFLCGLWSPTLPGWRIPVAWNNPNWDTVTASSVTKHFTESDKMRPCVNYGLIKLILVVTIFEGHSTKKIEVENV